ncbi:MAG: 3-dehydroquinate synthase [Gemmatimonadaceae bacterium]
MVSSTGDSVRRIDLFGYRVEIAPWLLDHVGKQVRDAAPAHTIALITDEDVAPFHAAHVVGSLRHFSGSPRILYRAIPSGEVHKTRETWMALTDWLLEERCGRDTTIVALGGGVIGDLAGFVAATFMRGIPFVQIPTSLLAMVDASVGGKVGVDTAAGKNLVGAFHQPARVIIDPVVLQTLPLAHLRSGMAEVIKHGVIADAEYLSQAESLGPSFLSAARDSARGATNTMEWHGAPLAALIARSVEIKASVVAQDEREGGIRRILNFGHTIGHAIEAASGFRLLHGESIAIGMSLEGELAERLGIAQRGTAAAIRHSLGSVGLPIALPHGFGAETLLDLMRMDKKSRAGEIVFALPARVGRMAAEESGYGCAVSETEIAAVLHDSSPASAEGVAR